MVRLAHTWLSLSSVLFFFFRSGAPQAVYGAPDPAYEPARPLFSVPAAPYPLGESPPCLTGAWKPHVASSSVRPRLLLLSWVGTSCCFLRPGLPRLPTQRRLRKKRPRCPNLMQIRSRPF